MKIIKKDRKVTTCDCCGKVNLKYTIKTTEGNFGCVCAPKLLEITHKEVERICCAISTGCIGRTFFHPKAYYEVA